jgi:CRP-like cAMP-binding protein
LIEIKPPQDRGAQKHKTSGGQSKEFCGLRLQRQATIGSRTPPPEDIWSMQNLAKSKT